MSLEIVSTQAVALGRDEARSLTEEVKQDAALLRDKLLRLYEGQAHVALGYGSWKAYWEAEFDSHWRTGYRELDAARVDRAIGPWANEPLPERQARELAPLLPDEQAFLETWREAKAEYGDKVTALNLKSLVQNRLARTEREAAKEERLRQPGTVPQAGERFRLIHGDLADVELDPESVDIIVTDPPYPREFLPCYELLAKKAAVFLKPGGSLLAMAGQAHLFDVGALMTPHLAYFWTLSYGLPGPKGRMWSQRIWVGWKPVIWFVKGKPERSEWVFDTATSDGADKRFHRWGQSVSGIAQLVERFSDPGDLVLDPFVGGGTTAVAALELGRRFVGIDIDATAIETTASRIADLELREAA